MKKKIFEQNKLFISAYDFRGFILYSAGFTAFRPVTRKTSNQNGKEWGSAQSIASRRQRERGRNQDKVDPTKVCPNVPCLSTGFYFQVFIHP